jgi:hypothetical protein
VLSFAHLMPELMPPDGERVRDRRGATLETSGGQL